MGGFTVLSWAFKLRTEIETLHSQSDGPSSQFKNKTNFHLFHYFSKKLELKNATWNFTAPGHTKTGADTAGANVKAHCDSAVTYHKDVSCARDIANVLKEKKAR